MKKNILLVFALVINTAVLYAQAGEDLSAIKLFIDPDKVVSMNADLPENLQSRLYTKITQLVNETGIAEVGYSNFLVVPKFNVLGTSVDQLPTGNVYMAECELFISISRREYANDGAASYISFSKRIIGSGFSKDEAIANAMNSISSSDKEVTNFFGKARTRINDYFKVHCQDVLKEAEQAYALNNYGKSIALYFSIPTNASCSKEARDASVKVYKRYLEDQCRKDLVQLKALVATIQTKDNTSIQSYNSVLAIINRLNPSSADCYAEALKEIGKIESRFNENQKNQWEMEKKRASDNAAISKEMVKAMGKINSSYQPSQPAGTIIITNK